MGKAFERIRWSVLMHSPTGRVAVVDQFERRMATLRQRVVAWVQLVMAFREGHPARLVMVTLTYARVGDYSSGDIRDYIKRLKDKIGDRLLAWAWVAEMQERGAVHYHLVALVENGTRFPMPDKSGMWAKGMSKVQTARTPWYLVKYIGKGHQKDFSRFPKGCRAYGMSIRFGGPEIAAVWRVLSGLKGGEDEPLTEWRYIGSAVTEGYARDVLAARALSYTRSAQT